MTLADLPQVSDGVSAHDSDELQLHSGSNPGVSGNTYTADHISHTHTHTHMHTNIQGEKETDTGNKNKKTHAGVKEGSRIIRFTRNWKPPHKTQS